MFITDDKQNLNKLEAVAQVFARHYGGQVVYRQDEPLYVRVRIKSSIALAVQILTDTIKANAGQDVFTIKGGNVELKPA